MTFNPNEDMEHIFATYAPNRKPKFKIHYQRGHAINALKDKSFYNNGTRTIPDDIILYQNHNGQWVEVDFNRTYSHDNPDLGF